MMPIQHNFASIEEFHAALRDWFAGHAAGSLCFFGDQSRLFIETAKQVGKTETGLIAALAYEIADAMLKAREQTQ